MIPKIFPSKPNPEEVMLDKQLSAGREQNTLAVGTDVNSDIYYDQQQKEREDLVRWQQDLMEELTNLEHDLKREIKTKEDKWIQAEDTIPACNDKCIHMIKTNCRPLLSRNMIMSNFAEERILQFLKRTMAAIVRNIVLKREEYDIEFFDISYVIATIKNVVLPAPYRAVNNGERRHLDTINRRIETYNENPIHEQRKKILGIF
jgi:hypothetical protein